MNAAILLALAGRHVVATKAKAKGKMAVAFSCLADARRLAADGHDAIAARAALRALAYSAGVKHADYAEARELVVAAIASGAPSGGERWREALRDTPRLGWTEERAYRVVRYYADPSPWCHYGSASQSATFATESDALAAAHDAWTIKGTDSVRLDKRVDGYASVLMNGDVGGLKKASKARVEERREEERREEERREEERREAAAKLETANDKGDAAK